MPLTCSQNVTRIADKPISNPASSQGGTRPKAAGDAGDIPAVCVDEAVAETLAKVSILAAVRA